MATTNTATDKLHALHRGEIAATETYNQALEKLADDPCASELRSIRDEHRTFANELRQHVRDLGDKPDQGSGTWGAWAKLVEGTAKVFGKNAALKALKEGEEHGLKDYESALEEAIPEECKTAIRGTLIPRTRAHIAALDRMMAT